ncbi:multicopper oxidase domain-containing protein [Ornithinibacillus sp. BX22]|uniref:Multicopper oxidase domain-containing protein n=1 Tax=Ornithinibacillus hominis TaxID=2763055 RepID=A0A923L692_9BACI|nr:multicopper oxidase domain-containing protein [Ornithinibacillus hominis]MBC5637275.1 multicopper oxidase domain-containing protein [Ornithinibacillus hominis]
MKKAYVYIAAIVIVVIGVTLLLLYLSKDDTSSSNPSDLSNLVESKPLPIPPLLEDVNPDPNLAEFHLTAQHGVTEILDGIESETLGYNGNILGPVIKVHEGDRVKVVMKNDLREATTLHWHGLRVDGENDGGPHSGIKPGETWEPEFTIEQPAATLWYHPHRMHATAKQVYEGLAGLFIIEDAVSDSLPIPKDYGVNDFPIIIQDKQLDASGNMQYDPGMNDMMMGLYGNAYLVNGAISPYLEVPKGMVRLRLLNGSNGRTYHFELHNGQEFYQIASDGGFLEKPVEMTSLTLSPAERAEILVDFSALETGDEITLIDTVSELGKTISEDEVEVMKFTVTDTESEAYPIPEQLTEIDTIDPADAVVTREMVMAGVGSTLTINDKSMDMGVIDEVVNLNDTEIWEVSNKRTGVQGGMAHPFHLHGVQFQVIDRDGNPPPANETGWKDTILVEPGETVRIITTFNHKGIFMYHCHILEHEDAGMMGQYEVK